MDATDTPTTWRATDVDTTNGHVDITAVCGCGAKYARARVETAEGIAVDRDALTAARAAITKGLTKADHAHCPPLQPEPDTADPRTIHDLTMPHNLRVIDNPHDTTTCPPNCPAVTVTFPPAATRERG